MFEPVPVALEATAPPIHLLFMRGGPGPVSFSGAYRGGCSGHEMPTFETSIGSFHKIEE
jgi:hypothetical protein